MAGKHCKLIYEFPFGSFLARKVNALTIACILVMYSGRTLWSKAFFAQSARCSFQLLICIPISKRVETTPKSTNTVTGLDANAMQCGGRSFQRLQFRFQDCSQSFTATLEPVEAHLKASMPDICHDQLAIKDIVFAKDV